jgi:uncharacterized membrane protein
MSKWFSRPASGRRDIRRLSTLALLTALLLLFAFTPLGFIPIFPAVAVTLLHIPVLVGLLCEGLGPGLLLGLLFGLVSWFQSWTSPTGLLSIFFRNPLISVLPRLCIPLVAWGAYRAIARLGRGRGRMPAAWAGAALAGSLTNTVVVLGMLYLVNGTKVGEALGLGATAITPAAVWAALGGVVLTNGLPEAVFSALVVPALLGALTRRRASLPGVDKR